MFSHRASSRRFSSVVVTAAAASLLLLLTGVALAPAAHAAGTTYSDLTSFSTAAGAQTLVTFESTNTPVNDSKYYGPGLTITDAANGSVTFNTYNPAIYGSQTSTYNNAFGGFTNVQNTAGQQTSFYASYQYYDYAGSGGRNETEYNGQVRFAQGQTSFGTLYGSYGNDYNYTTGQIAYQSPTALNALWRVDFFSGGAGGTLVGSATLTSNYSPNSPAFFGYTSDTAFDTVVFTGTSTPSSNPVSAILFLDDVRYSTSTNLVQPVPEPGAVVTGLVMAGTTGMGLVRGRIRRRK